MHGRLPRYTQGMDENPYKSPEIGWLTSTLLAGSIACAGFALIVGAYGLLRLIFEMRRPELTEAKITIAVAVLLGSASAAMYWGYWKRGR